jgi:ParB family transcriptional regulator, chromosome partitioning protein
MANRKALGRGLQALIPDAPVTTSEQEPNIQSIDIALISPNPFQPRVKFDSQKLNELKNSIQEKGVIQPVTVRPYDGGYQLIAGERRLRAVRDLAFTSIPAYILDIQTDEEMMELSIIENIHREDLNPIDIAVSYDRLIKECQLTQEQVAQKVGKDRSTITNFLRLLKLPGKIRSSVESGQLSMGHARALLAISNKENQLEIWQKILSNDLSVRKVEKLAKEGPAKKPPKSKELEKKSFIIDDMEHKLRTQLTTRISIKTKANGGSIEIDFYDDDDLDRLVQLICDQ